MAGKGEGKVKVKGRRRRRRTRRRNHPKGKGEGKEVIKDVNCPQQNHNGKERSKEEAEGQILLEIACVGLCML